MEVDEAAITTWVGMTVVAVVGNAEGACSSCSALRHVACLKDLVARIEGSRQISAVILHK